MKHDSISLTRRQLMIAGIAAPAGALAAPFVASSTAAAQHPLLMSGRLVDAQGKAVANALIEVADTSTTTDGDGRFMIRTTAGVAGGDLNPLDVRVTAATQSLSKQLHFESARVLRDEAGLWRAGVSLNLA